MVDWTDLEGLEPYMLSAYAREQLGVNAAKFARLVGRSESSISKRERGKAGLGEVAQVLVELLARVVPDVIPARNMLEALQAVPLDERSEYKALLVAMRVCSGSEEGRDAIDAVIGMTASQLGVDVHGETDENGDPEPNPEAPMRMFLRIVRDSRERLKDDEAFSDPDISAYLEKAVLLSAQLEETIDIALRMKARKAASQPKPPPGDPPDGGDG